MQVCPWLVDAVIKNPANLVGKVCPRCSFCGCASRKIILRFIAAGDRCLANKKKDSIGIRYSAGKK